MAHNISQLNEQQIKKLESIGHLRKEIGIARLVFSTKKTKHGCLFGPHGSLPLMSKFNNPKSIGLQWS